MTAKLRITMTGDYSEELAKSVMAAVGMQGYILSREYPATAPGTNSTIMEFVKEGKKPSAA